MLTAQQIAAWRNEGFVVAGGVLPSDLVAQLASAAADRFPAAGTAESEAVTDFGSAVNFPSDLAALNEVTLHERLLGAVSELLDVEPIELRLTQSDVWAKYGRTDRRGGELDNQDQRIHIDYPNHTLVHPTPWDRPEAVEIILYLSDIAGCGGSTAVVPRKGADDPAYRWPIVDSPGIGPLRWVNDRQSAETYLALERPEVVEWRAELYEREVITRFTPGTMLLYRHDTWHRGTAMLPGTRRLAQNLTFRKAECEWIAPIHHGWAWAMYRNDQLMERLVGELSVTQRTVLGFPAPGSSYWCDETLAAVTARYGCFGFDPAPYK